MKYLLLFLATIFISFLFLFKPEPKGKWSGEYVRINKYCGIFLTSDAYNFCREASNPKSLFDTASVRQDRPAYLLLIYSISKPTKYILQHAAVFFNAADKIDYKYLAQKSEAIINNPSFEVKQKPLPAQNIVIDYFPVYISFVLVNMMILFLSAVIFDKTLSRFNIDKSIKLIFIAILFINRIVKAYILNVHMQLFILFAPLLFVYVIIKIVESEFNKKKIFAYSFLMGFMSLFYGSFIFFLPVLFLILLYRYKKMTDIIAHWNVFLFSFVLIILPTFLWVVLLKNIVGRYYNYEVEHYREYVWIADALKISFFNFIVVSVKFLIAFIICIIKTVAIFTLIYGLLVITAKKHKNFKYKEELFIYLYFILLVFSVMFLMLGFYQVRLTYTLAPVLFVLIALLWQELLNKHMLSKNTILFGYAFAILYVLNVLLTNSYYQ